MQNQPNDGPGTARAEQGTNDALFAKADERRFNPARLHTAADVKSPTTIEGDRVVIHIRAGDGGRYDIARSQIPSKDALLQWVRHLASKAWMDNESLAVFIDKTARAQNLKIWERDY